MLLEAAAADARVVSGAIVGSLASGAGDAWSDIDLTFGLRDGAGVGAVLDDWTETVMAPLDAVALFDVGQGATTYRVFLLPGSLQVDLSFTPQPDFRGRGGSFALLFGSAAPPVGSPSPSARHLFGLAAHHAVRARAAIGRGLVWQAEHWIAGTRDEALVLACRRHGLRTDHGRGLDRLPAATLELARGSLVASLEQAELLRALAAAVELLLREADEVRDVATRLEERLRGLTG